MASSIAAGLDFAFRGLLAAVGTATFREAVSAFARKSMKLLRRWSLNGARAATSWSNSPETLVAPQLRRSGPRSVSRVCNSATVTRQPFFDFAGQPGKQSVELAFRVGGRELVLEVPHLVRLTDVGLESVHR